MHDDTILPRVARILEEHLGAEAGQVNEGTAMLDLGADSLDVIELVMAAEHEFAIEIADEEVPEAAETTVGDLVALIRGKLPIVEEGADG